MLGKCQESLELCVGVEGTADDVYACERVHRLAVFLALQVDVIQAVLPVEPVHHATLDGLNHHNAGVEVGLLIHVVDNPVYKGTQEVALAKLDNSFGHDALGRSTLVKCLELFHFDDFCFSMFLNLVQR